MQSLTIGCSESAIKRPLAEPHVRLQHSSSKMVIDLHFSASKQTYSVLSNALDLRLREPPVVCTFRRKSTQRELILSIGQTEDEIRKDSTYQNVAKQGEFRFFDPFRPNTFSAFFAEAVLRYYLAKASMHKRSDSFLQKLIDLIGLHKFDLVLNLEDYDKVLPTERKQFETSLSEVRRIKSWRMSTEIEGTIEGTFPKGTP